MSDPLAFPRAVERMRRYQVEYFTTRDPSTLRHAKVAEAEVDRLVNELLLFTGAASGQQQTLFPVERTALPPVTAPTGAKAAYVRRQVQTRPHHCHWPGCLEQVAPAMWGCLSHWRALPADLRNRVWRAYRPGQEVDGTPSADYVAVAREVQEWIHANHGATRQPVSA